MKFVIYSARHAGYLYTKAGMIRWRPDLDGPEPVNTYNNMDDAEAAAKALVTLDLVASHQVAIRKG